MSKEFQLEIPRDSNGNVNFIVLSEDTYHEIALSISGELNKCRKCPISEIEYGDKGYVTVDDRQELCGECPTYKSMRELASKMPDYDLTKRQRVLLNKGENISPDEVVELFYSGVQKIVIARCLGFPDARGRFDTFLRKHKIVLPKQYKHDFDEMQEYQTNYLDRGDSQ